MAGGRTNREIARQLVLGEETIKKHVGRVPRKLGAGSRAAAAARVRWASDVTRFGRPGLGTPP